MFLDHVKRRLPLLAHNHNYRWAWAATIFTSFEEMLSLTALTLYVYNLTGSGAALSLLFAFSTLPAMLIGPIAGVTVDRFNRKRVVVAAGIWLVLVYVGYALAQTIPQFYTLIALASLGLAFTRNAQLALLPDIVPEQELVDANALIALNFNLALMIAPILGGLLVGGPGAAIAFLLLAGCRALAVLCQSRIAYQPHRRQEQRIASTASFIGSLRAGLQHARNDFVIRTVLLTLLGANFAGSALGILETVLLKKVLNAGDAGYGLMLSFAGIGAVAASFLIKPLTTRWELLRVFSSAVICTGLLFFPFANILWLPATLGTSMFQGLVWVTGLVLTDTLVQQTVPEKLRGRIFSLLLLIRNGMTLAATATFGLLVDSLGAVLLLNVAGLIYTSAGVFALWMLRNSKTAPITTATH